MSTPTAGSRLGGEMPPGIRAPDRVLLWLEQRALFELGALVAASPWLRLLGRGDQHPVLVLPGFTASDVTTTPLRWQLRSWGYWAHGWQLGRNLGPTPAVLEGLVDRLTTLHERHGRKVSLIGWSLGGIYARELARQFPDSVRSVITLGSPYRMGLHDRSSVSRLLDRLLGGFDPGVVESWVAEDDRVPLTMPATSIYTRTDGVVRWHTCIDRDGPLKENIEVLGSHSGLVFNPAVLYVLFNRLAQPEDDWRPFEAPVLLRRLYPRPATWGERRPPLVSATDRG
jgi:pimeloyl-ACP methyl ester carboxylesterase